MDNQQIFDIVYKHLLTQGRPAIDEGGNCSYLTYDGRKCAVGALIPENLYTETIEGCPVSMTDGQHADSRALRDILLQIGIKLEQFSFLQALQSIHDRAPTDPDRFKQNVAFELETLAHEYNLEIPPRGE